MSVRVLSLAKGTHKYIFRYTPGCENQVIDEIMRLADDPDTNLDWLDAATLGFQVAHYTAIACQEAAKVVKSGSVGPRENTSPSDHATDGPCANCP